MVRADHDDVNSVLDALASARHIALNKSYSLPPVAYLSPGFYALESERIFAKEWLCVGHADEIPEVGDFFCTEIVGEQIIVVRQTKEHIQALSNVCRHRSAKLLEGRGREQRIVCPYHGWTYDLGGCLVGASFMESAESFEITQIRLPRLRLEIWNRFLFINLDDDAVPLGARLAPLDPLIGLFHMEEMTYHFGAEMVWEANWKVITENFTENYHTFRIHPDTLNLLNPTRMTRMLEVGGAFHAHLEPYNDQREPLPGSYHPDVPESERSHVVLFAVFPSATFGSHARRTFSFSIFPLGPERSRVKWGIAMRDDLSTGELAQIVTAYNEIIAEDRIVVEGLQTAAHSRRAKPGRLSHLEGSTWDLGRYLAERLVDV